ncbi:protein unc-50 homolog isoform X4 [Dermacentor andersoni]|uniref:protein unc-50 homolog isoform X4 n=1 Tax=Dermacentor andersoni TaxID=34620 RepID=UPI003B3A7A8F
MIVVKNNAVQLSNGLTVASFQCEWRRKRKKSEHRHQVIAIPASITDTAGQPQILAVSDSGFSRYRNFQYRKQTKDQFARDDPAFLVLLGLWLVASSVGFVLILHISFLGFLKFLLWVIFIDCIGMGVLVATALWLISNKYLLKPTCRSEDVEWGYAFDVHLNAFFPPLVVLHVFQLFFSRLLSHHISLLFGNTLWLIALGYYIYITFLGYSALPILKNTHIFLYPLALLLVCYIVTLVCNINLCEALNDFYAYRVM